MKSAPFVQHDVQVFGLVVIVALFATVIVGTGLGRRYRVGPPVLLIGLGALLGLIPRFGHVQLDGEIVLLLFLPAILYWESLNTSIREIRANLRVIVLLSVGLVIASAVAVTWTARAFGMESHAAAVRHGVPRGGGARRGALPDGRRRCRRSGQAAPPPHADRVESRKHHQR